ncbi:MAG: YbjN domain-containing protein [Christensenellales bacterium]
MRADSAYNYFRRWIYGKLSRDSQRIFRGGRNQFPRARRRQIDNRSFYGREPQNDSDQPAFRSDGEHIVMADCWDVVKVAENKVEKAYALCNELNEKFRWVKFYVDSDRDIRVQLDAIMSEDNAGEVCREIVYRMVNIIDGAYIEIVRALLL